MASRSSSRLSIPAAVTVGAVAVIALIASGVLRPTPATGATPSQSPSTPASPAAHNDAGPRNPGTRHPRPGNSGTRHPRPGNSGTRHPAPATPEPADPSPAPGVRGPVRLDIATPHEVVLEVWDYAAAITSVRSGRAGDGMSVRWNEMQIENLGPSTLRLTWIGFPVDDDLILATNEHDGVLWLTLAQPVPPPNSDGLGFDRVVILQFASPIDAADVQYVIQEGVDTPGF